MGKIERHLLSDRAYYELRKGLTAGHFTPGDPLIIRKLAHDYGISTTPIREALQRLVAERLLELLPNRSISVPLMTKARFHELFVIRRTLEGLATEMALPNLTTYHKEDLRRLLGQMDETMQGYDSARYLTLNREFHFIIYENANNDELLQMIDDMWAKVGPVFTALFNDDHYRLHANDQHLQVVEAILHNEPEEARKAIDKDLYLAAQSLLPRLKGR